MIVELSNGRFGEIPARFRPQFEEGRLASEKKFQGLPENPYQHDYSSTGDKEALWKSVAWFHGFRQGI